MTCFVKGRFSLLTSIQDAGGRARPLADRYTLAGPVVYWMSRDQRVRDNWALLHAQQIAVRQKAALAVVFCLVPSFLGATLRQYQFMMDGLRETATALEQKNIPFVLLSGKPDEMIPCFVRQNAVGTLVADFDPLRIKRSWKTKVADAIAIPFLEVDAHNVVPCRVASGKQEYAARTMRPKIHRLLPEYLIEYPRLRKHRWKWSRDFGTPDWGKASRTLRIDRSVGPVEWLKAGEKAARATLKRFIHRKLSSYASQRNDPNTEALSDLSPYLHFGQISAQRVALEVRAAQVAGDDMDAFLEELIVRRELADNFCYYNDHYDTFEGFPAWAQKTLNRHRRDRREALYDLDEFARGETHDALWNAAQQQMVVRGKMHGYLRMYWAKKILEWTASPEEALAIAIELNDRYELDGRDPSGYTGIAWSIGGLHDRPWGERPVFGSVRYMSEAGCRRKFDVDAYIRRFANVTK